MSAAPVFLLTMSIAPEQAQTQLEQLWETYRYPTVPIQISVWAVESLGKAFAHVFLPYYYRDDEYKQYLRRSIEYLFSVAEDGTLYYLRSWGVFIDGADPDYPRLITVDELLEKFEPSFHDGVQYRYQLEKLT